MCAQYVTAAVVLLQCYWPYLILVFIHVLPLRPPHVDYIYTHTDTLFCERTFVETRIVPQIYMRKYYMPINVF